MNEQQAKDREEFENDLCRRAVEAAILAEREACAKLCDPSNSDRPDDWTEYAKTKAECAAAIRMRSNSM